MIQKKKFGRKSVKSISVAGVKKRPAAGPGVAGPKASPGGVKLLYSLMNARETITQNRASGLLGPKSYHGLPEQHAAYFRRYSCPNVRRRQDRTSRELHKLAAATERFALCKTEAERQRLKRLFVLNFALWRFIGGTAVFAREVGFLTDWTTAEHAHVRRVVKSAWRKGRTDDLFTDAYAGPGKVRLALKYADAAKLRAVLYNRGPQAFNTGPMQTMFTVHGKLLTMDLLWTIAHDVVDAASPDPVTGVTHWQPAVNVLGRVPWFGANDDGMRVPTFFAKEVAQDLLDTPVFEGGRANVADLRSFCPAGPGALLGLMMVYGLRKQPTQHDAISMMLGLLQAAGRPGGWKHGDPTGLELHDIQFMLCELQKVGQTSKPMNNVRMYPGHSLGSRSSLKEDLSSSKCLDWLEEALLLFPMADTQETATQALASWLRLPGDQVNLDEQRRTLCHGDGIHLSLYSDGAGLEFSKKRALVVSSACRSVQKKGRSAAQPTLFNLERAEGTGEVHFGDHIFLRTHWGAHVGPSSQSPQQHPTLTAPPKSERYEDARRFWLEPCRLLPRGTKTANVVWDGDCVRLRCLHPCAGEEGAFMQVAEVKVGVQHQRTCLLVDASAGPDTSLQALRVKRDQGPIIAAQHLRESVAEAIQLGIRQGRLRCGQHGLRNLELVEPEAVRIRLTGCRTVDRHGHKVSADTFVGQ